MKYLNKFENFKNFNFRPKFKVGDWVRIVNDSYPDGWQSEPYKVLDVEYRFAFNKNNEYIEGHYYFIDTGKGGKVWRAEKNLITVPEEELAAIKYNL
jgi:hypothetical protein